MEENISKAICIVLLFVDTLLFGWPPYLLVRSSNNSPRAVMIRSLIISYLTCFAGGVFLGACLLHLLVEGREVMEEYFKSVGKPDTNFPIYEAVVACGFFSIALVEQIAHTLLHNAHPTHGRSDNHGIPDNQGRPDNVRPDNVRPDNQGRFHLSLNHGSYSLKRDDNGENKTEPGLDNHAFTKGTDSETSLSISEKQDEVPIKGSHAIFVGSYNNGIVLKPPTSSDNLVQMEANPETIATEIEQAKPKLSSRFSTSTDGAHDHDAELVHIVQVMEVNPLRAFLLLGALSFHTIFDGLAVGLQEESNNIWEIFAAICIHKSLVAVCLGLQLFLAFRSKPIMGFIWVFVFSLIAPVGVGVGMALTSGSINSDVENLVNWILQAIATGTFLYVTIFEILREEFTRNGSFLRILVAVIGFGGMAVAKYFDKD